MQTDEQAIRQLVAEWMRASQAGETEKVLRLMADDVVFLVPGHPPMSKAEFAASQAAMRDVEIEGHSQIQEVRVLGDFAYMWTRLSVEVKPKNGKPIKRAGHTLSVLEKQNGKWVLLRDANLLTTVQ